LPEVNICVTSRRKGSTLWIVPTIMRDSGIQATIDMQVRMDYTPLQ